MLLGVGLDLFEMSVGVDYLTDRYFVKACYDQQSLSSSLIILWKISRHDTSDCFVPFSQFVKKKIYFFKDI